jgi:hypothetical protein
MDPQNYYTNWFPYSVHAQRVQVPSPDLDQTWRWRRWFAVGAIAVLAWSQRPSPSDVDHPDSA